ncbi:hypothetical protein ED733_007495 [Metarhizium rileyi]|uniref:Stc1 domain-containing protein n=1 Tax=Metarhizium rileyi (strain RCEF 4871) TaxID=1649241 RepID=A0A5C6GD73_METRR|nr:hypothetical protein ED733_007495 [Metarhizium rileyi]
MTSNKRSTAQSSLRSEPALPARYKCKTGGEWKPLQFFSKNQQQLLQRQNSSRGGIDAANTGMTCMEHSAAFRGEIRCELCGLGKPVDEFSKSMRRSDEPTCLRCTAWSEIQEPGVTPMPLQTGHISVEEEKKEFWENQPNDTTYFSPDVTPQAPPITALTILGIRDRDSETAGGKESCSAAPSSLKGPSSVASAPRSVASTGQMPPHLESIVTRLMQKDGIIREATPGKDNKGNSSSSVSENIPGWLNGNNLPSIPGSTRSGMGISDTEQSNLIGKLPPHLQGKISSMVSRTSQFQHVSPGPSSQVSIAKSISTATTLRSEQDNRQPKTKIPYNAWDNVGKLHDALKSPTASEGDTASNSSNCATQNLVELSGDWNKVPIKKMYWPKSKKNWHTAPRLESRLQPGADHTSAEHVDSDMDRQKGLNYY